LTHPTYWARLRPFQDIKRSGVADSTIEKKTNHVQKKNLVTIEVYDYEKITSYNMIKKTNIIWHPRP
jgi:hypothetical protein